MSLRVLIVEDEEPFAAALDAALTQAGHRVIVARSGEEALLHRGCEVVVTDVGLPGIDGLELLEELRLRGEHPRAVVVSGLADLDHCQRALRLGAEEFLVKPFAIEEVVRAVTRRPRSRAMFDRSYDALPDAPDHAARELVAHSLRCAVPPAARARVGAVCAELVDNAVVHAFPGSRGAVRVVATIEPRHLDLTVSDDGVGFDALDAGLDEWTDCRAGGLARVAALAEDVRVDATPGHGTRVLAHFHIATALFDEEEQLDLSELDWLPPAAARQVLAACDEDPEGASRFLLSPALAVTLGRLLAGPDPRRVLRTALWS